MNNPNKLRNLFLFFLISIFLASCQPRQGINSSDDILGTKTALSNPVVTTPTFTDETGGLHIRLVNLDTNGPVIGMFIYLANMLPVQGNLKDAYVPSLDLTTAPRSKSTNQGDVVISMIPPGKYAIALFTPLGPILIKEATTKKEIIFDITAGKVTDLGDKSIILDQKTINPGK